MTSRWGDAARRFHEEAAARALAPTDAAALGMFRVALGLIGLVSAGRFFAYGFLEELFIRPKMFLPYWGFAFLPAPGPFAIRAIFGALAALSVLVMVGLWYRAAIALYVVLFTYVQLLDVSNYLNHYYLLSWLGLLGCVVPLHQAFSVDAKRHGWAPVLPAWCTWLFRFQVGVVYIFAGLAKLSSDWLLHAQPLQIWLSARSGMPIIGPYLDRTWVAYVAAWSGFLFDTTIVFFLLARRTRPFAYAAVVVFHVATWVLFPIGMFPFLMMGGALVFFSPSWPRRFLPARREDEASASLALVAPPSAPRARLMLAAFGVYALFQIGMPLRAHLYGGDVQWHEQGMRFAWRVMVREKNGSLMYRVVDKDTGRRWEVSPRKHLVDRQAREVASQPDLILQLAHVVARDAREQGHPNVAVYADTRVSWNGRPGTALIDPSVDLSSVADGVAKARWILPSPTTPPAHLTPLARR